MLLGCLYHPKTVGLYLVLPYYTWTRWIRCDELHDGNHWPAFSQHFGLFHSMRKFLGLTIQVVPNQLNHNQQYIFAVFPHGVNADYRILMDGMLHDVLSSDLANNVRVLAAIGTLLDSLVRELALWTGCVDARKVCRNTTCFKTDIHSSYFQEVKRNKFKRFEAKEVVYLKKRMGFVKLALAA